MSSKVRAIVFDRHGTPSEVVRCVEIELPPLGPGDARVRLLAAPINPADLNVIEGKYPVRPALPGVPGVEGVGVVEEVGGEVAGLYPGERVLWPHGIGTWREAGVMNAATLRVVPPEIPVLQAAMLKINPPTALRMMRDFATLGAGDWLLQNAANSGVGRAVIQIAAATGLRTINLVRRRELIEELRLIGADAVLLDDGDLRDEIAAVTKGADLQLALNAVGGESAIRMANALATGGTVVTYGAMGRQPLRIPNGLLIFKDLRWRGFWISQWYRGATPEAEAAMFAELFDLAQRGILHTPVERIYSLEEIAAALVHAAGAGRGGKVLLGSPEIIAASAAP